MLVFAAASSLARDELLRKTDATSILLLSPEKIGSLEELELAYFLARKSFNTKYGIAKSFKFEFLLWLAGRKDIHRAMDVLSFNDPAALLIISFGEKKRHVLALLQAEEKPLELKKKSNPLRVEEISLSRI